MFFNHFKEILKERKSKRILKGYDDPEVSSKKEPKGFLLVNEEGKTQILEEGEDEEESPDQNEQDVLAKAIHEIDLNLEPKIEPSFYYYKRWIWIAFPWICLQQDKRYNYSTLINECYSSNLKYLSVSDDMLLTECSL